MAEHKRGSVWVIFHLPTMGAAVQLTIRSLACEARRSMVHVVRNPRSEQ